MFDLRLVIEILAVISFLTFVISTHLKIKDASFRIERLGDRVYDLEQKVNGPSRFGK